jgi:hypothetical protein
MSFLNASGCADPLQGIGIAVVLGICTTEASTPAAIPVFGLSPQS